jgi:hypothetical protein
MRTPAEKAAAAIQQYTQNVHSMSVFARQRAESRIYHLLELAGRKSRIQYEKAFIDINTGDIMVSKLDTMPGWIAMQGQTLNRFKYPKVFKVIGHKHTIIPVWARVLGLFGFKYVNFTLPKV